MLYDISLLQIIFFLYIYFRDQLSRVIVMTANGLTYMQLLQSRISLTNIKLSLLALFTIHIICLSLKCKKSFIVFYFLLVWKTELLCPLLSASDTTIQVYQIKTPFFKNQFKTKKKKTIMVKQFETIFAITLVLQYNYFALPRIITEKLHISQSVVVQQSVSQQSLAIYECCAAQHYEHKW